jgi:hypothetical protein
MGLSGSMPLLRPLFLALLGHSDLYVAARLSLGSSGE